MGLLILGLLVWSGVHLLKGVAPNLRAALGARIGEGGSKALAALLLVLSIYLMVQGWQAAEFTPLWTAPIWTRHLASLAMLIAFVLFFVGPVPWLRHPQLTGFKLWAFVHILLNGDLTSLVLFGGLLAWAVAEVIVINRRDGAWVPPDPKPMPAALIGPGIGVLLWFVFVFWAHAWLFGVSPLG